MAKNISLSLADIAGADFIEAVATARELIDGVPKSESIALGNRKVDFYPETYARQQDKLLESVGKQVAPPFEDNIKGSASNAFSKAFHGNMAPVFTKGMYRIGADGRLYLAGKSEHYQASLGHGFPGFELLEIATKLGISNITHNNTRGHITRVAEREIVRIANGLAPDSKELDRLCNEGIPGRLCRVINLETGSLVMEAAVKMMLARFYRLHNDKSTPTYQGKTPVFLVMADFGGGREANYHGTTVLTQLLRGMWPDVCTAMEDKGILRVRQVAINDIADFKAAVAEFDSGSFKIAGFLHELVLMNYGGIRLKEEYIQEAYRICAEHDIPTAVDEIQTGLWSPKVFLFREYGLNPCFVSAGKGFPGGAYPASKLIFTPEMDNLDLFGALVTNGQEELASLAYIIAMRFAEANAAETAEVGAYFRTRLEDVARRHKGVVEAIDGQGLLEAIRFRNAEKAAAFAEEINKKCCIDISAQTYKANCPPAALMKLPLIATKATVDFVAECIDKILP